VVSFDVLDGILCAESSEWNGQVVPQGTFLAALVCKVIDELAVFAIFACERVLQLKHGSGSVSALKGVRREQGCVRIYGDTTVAPVETISTRIVSKIRVITYLKTLAMVVKICSRRTTSVPDPAVQSASTPTRLEAATIQSRVPLGVFSWKLPFPSFPISVYCASRERRGAVAR
jgi:hypothetical protein